MLLIPQLQKRNSIWRYFGITKDCKDPISAIKWIDYCYASEEGQRFYGYGVEGLSYTLDESGKPKYYRLHLEERDLRSIYGPSFHWRLSLLSDQ